MFSISGEYSPFTFPLCLFHCSHYKDIDVNISVFFFFSKITFVHVQRLWIAPPQSVVGNIGREKPTVT